MSQVFTASRVLVVEDDPDCADALKILLQDSGYLVDVASNGLEALAVLRAGAPPDVVVLDLMMPVMAGEQLLNHLEADQSLRAIPTVVVTAAHILPRENPRGVPVLRKPVDFGELVRLLDETTGRTR